VRGLIVFGSLMGAMFIGQQFLQNVLGYSTVDAGLAILPAGVCMVIVAPRSAKLVEARGARFTLLFGYAFVLLGFLTMLLLWKENIDYWKVGLGYAFVGIGVGLAGTPASHSLTGSVPVKRVGMASGTADLQRDLGGAIMQSIFGALLTAGYASAAGTLVTSSGRNVTSSTEATLTKSSLQRRRPGPRATPLRCRARSSPGRRRPSCKETSGRIWPESSPSWSAAPSSRSSSRAPQREQQLLQSYQSQDAAPAAEEASELTSATSRADVDRTAARSMALLPLPRSRLQRRASPRAAAREAREPAASAPPSTRTLPTVTRTGPATPATSEAEPIQPATTEEAARRRPRSS
jgi:hypothetical protein